MAAFLDLSSLDDHLRQPLLVGQCYSVNSLNLLALELSFVCCMCLQPKAVPSILCCFVIRPLIGCILLLPLVSHRFSFPLFFCFAISNLFVFKSTTAGRTWTFYVQTPFFLPGHPCLRCLKPRLCHLGVFLRIAVTWQLVGQEHHTCHVSKKILKFVLCPCGGITSRRIGSHDCATRKMSHLYAIGT